MIALDMPIPTECYTCNFSTPDDNCMAMGGASLWEFFDEGEHWEYGWKCEKCPLVDLGDKEEQE